MLRWRLAVAAVGLVSLLSGTQSVFAFGSLAISDERSTAYGISTDESSVAAARLQAVTNCGAGCRAVVDFRNACAAYAADQTRDNGPFGWAHAPTPQGAQDLAMRYCRQRGGQSCRVRVWACERFRARDARATARYVGTSNTAFLPNNPPPGRSSSATGGDAVKRLTDLLNGVVAAVPGAERDAPPKSSEPPLFGNDAPGPSTARTNNLFEDSPSPPPDRARSTNLFEDGPPKASDPPVFANNTARPATTARSNNLFEDGPPTPAVVPPPQSKPRSNGLFEDVPPPATNAGPPQKVTLTTPPLAVKTAPASPARPSGPGPQTVARVTPPQVAVPAPGPIVVPNVSVPSDGIRKIALVVGNDRYDSLPVLQKAANDARAIGDKLVTLGFEVIRIENASRRRMNQKLVEFAGKVGRGDTAFFFFAGHGVEIRGINYLLPTDTPAARDNEEALIAAEGIPAPGIVDQLQERGAKVTMLVLDACRDNPFKKPGTRGIGGTRGLGQMTAPEGVFVLYSAGVGQTALDRLSDKDANPNSVFTRTLVRMLGQPGLTVQTMAKQTQAEVHRLARTVRHTQMPAYYDQILGVYALVPGR